MSVTRGDRDQRLGVAEVSRRGAHRPRTNPVLGLLPLAGLGVLVIGVALLAYLLFGRGGEATTATTGTVTAPSAAAGPSPSAAAGPSPSAAPSAAAPVAPSPSAGAGDPSSAPSAAALPRASADRSVTVNFYNGSSPNVPGLSRQAANRLKEDGWTIGEIADWTGGSVDRTTVYYADAAQLATARAVIADLGLGAAKLNTRYAQGGSIAVVISNDYSR